DALEASELRGREERQRGRGCRGGEEDGERERAGHGLSLSGPARHVHPASVFVLTSTCTGIRGRRAIWTTASSVSTRRHVYACAVELANRATRRAGNLLHRRLCPTQLHRHLPPLRCRRPHRDERAEANDE